MTNEFGTVVIINEMNHILDRYARRELSNGQALKLLMKKFEELQTMGAPEGSP